MSGVMIVWKKKSEKLNALVDGGIDSASGGQNRYCGRAMYHNNISNGITMTVMSQG
jgi:hypothetical protein